MENEGVLAVSEVLAVIRSRSNLSRINSILNKYPGKHGVPRICWDRSGSQTSLTYILMDKEKYSAMEENGFCTQRGVSDDLGEYYSLSKYRIPDRLVPGDGRTSDIYIRVPLSLTGEKARCRIYGYVRDLIRFGVIKEDKHIKIIIPSKDRNLDTHLGKLFIYFKDEVTEISRIITKLVLQDVCWDIELLDHNERENRIQCVWVIEKTTDSDGWKTQKKKGGGGKPKTILSRRTST
jgi:hypothetical protein